MDNSVLASVYHEIRRARPNRWLGFFVAVVIACITAVVVIAMPDQYQSSARVFVNREAVLKPLLRGLTVDDNQEGRQKFLRVFQTTLLNDDNISRLVNTPGMGFDAATATGRSAGLSTIKSGVTIVDEGDNNVFSVTYYDSNPTRARNVVHGLLSTFIETTVIQARTDLTTAQKFLEDQIAEYEAKLRDIETRLADYRVKNVEVLGEPSFQVRLTAARTALRDAQLQRQVALATRDRIKAQVDKAALTGAAVPSSLMGTDQAGPNVIDRLSALQQQLNQLLLQYTEKHPDVVATRREIALLSEQYGLSESLSSVTQPMMPGQVSPARAVDSAAGQIGASSSRAAAASNVQQASYSANQGGRDASSAGKMQLLQANFALMDAERKVEIAQTALGAIDQYSATAPEAEAGLDQLTRDYTLLKENYDQLLRRRESARMTQAVDLTSGTDQFRILQAPTIASSPASPDRRTFLLVGAFLSTIVGAALAYALGLLRGTFVSAAEAERELGLPVIAQLSNTQGLLTRASKSADALLLLGGIASMFVAAYVLSAATGFLSPMRAEIYQFLETDIGKLFGHLL